MEELVLDAEAPRGITSDPGNVILIETLKRSVGSGFRTLSLLCVSIVGNLVRTTRYVRPGRRRRAAVEQSDQDVGFGAGSDGGR
jgi:hypothetical protein